MYPKEIVDPMKQELVNAGFINCDNANEIKDLLLNTETTLFVINSVCGCAAGSARPAVIHSLSNEKKPKTLVTSFAGFDKEAVEEARKYLMPFPPSSPCIVLFKNGELVHILERHHIEGNSAEAISQNLIEAYNNFC